eukprot:scaffold310_cov307-Pinguiococcus_pyrenoidosus.AAC.5
MQGSATSMHDGMRCSSQSEAPPGRPLAEPRKLLYPVGSLGPGLRLVLADGLLPQRFQHRRQRLLDRLAVELVARREQLVLRGPWAVHRGFRLRPIAADQRDGLQHLIDRQASVAALLPKVLEHQVDGGLVSAKLFGIRILQASARHSLADLDKVRLHERHGAVHLAVAVTHDASVDGVHEDRLAVLLLHALNRDVLSALELDQVLQAVDNLQRAIRREDRNVSTVEEALRVELLRRLLRLLQVATGYARSTNENLCQECCISVQGIRLEGRPARGAPWKAGESRESATHHLAASQNSFAIVHRVGREVGLIVAIQDGGDHSTGLGALLVLLRLCAVAQHDLDAGHRRAHDQVAGVGRILDRSRASRLGQGIALALSKSNPHVNVRAQEAKLFRVAAAALRLRRSYLDERRSKRDANEGLHLGRNGTATGDEQLRASAQQGLEALDEENGIEKGRVHVVVDHEIAVAKGQLEEAPDQAALLRQAVLHAFLEDVPDLRNSGHASGPELLDASRWRRVRGVLLSRLGDNRAVIELTDGALGGDGLWNVRGRQVRKIGFLPRDHDPGAGDVVQQRGNAGADVALPDHDALGLARATAGVHDDGHVLRLRLAQRDGLAAAQLHDLVHAQDGDSAAFDLGRRGSLLRGDVVGRVDDMREHGHPARVLRDLGHVLVVAEDDLDVALLRRVRHAGDPERRVAGCAREALGHRADHRRDPVRAGVLEDKQRVRVGRLLVAGAAVLSLLRG